MLRQLCQNYPARGRNYPARGINDSVNVCCCSPTPRVTWERINATKLPDRHRFESFGQRLTIDNVQFEDAGKYECQGINDMAMVPVRRSMDLSVECKCSLNNITAF